MLLWLSFSLRPFSSFQPLSSTFTHWLLHINSYTLTFIYWVLHIDFYILTFTHWPLHIDFYTLTFTYWLLHINCYISTFTYQLFHIEFYILTFTTIQLLVWFGLVWLFGWLACPGASLFFLTKILTWKMTNTKSL